MRKTLLMLVIGVLLMIAAVGCGGGGGGDSTPLGNNNTVTPQFSTPPAASLRVFRPSDTWTLTGSGTLSNGAKTINLAVTETNSVVNVPSGTPAPLAIVISMNMTASNGKTITSNYTLYINQDAQHNVTAVAKVQDGNTYTYNPSRSLYPGSWFNSTSWLDSYVENNQNRQNTYVVTSQEGVSTPMSDFNCWKISATYSTNGVNSAATIWVAPEVGIIRQVENMTMLVDGVVYTGTVDLKITGANLHY